MYINSGAIGFAKGLNITMSEDLAVLGATRDLLAKHVILCTVLVTGQRIKKILIKARKNCTIHVQKKKNALIICINTSVIQYAE